MSNYEKLEIIDKTLETLYRQLERGNFTTEATINIITSIEKLENLKEKIEMQGK